MAYLDPASNPVLKPQIFNVKSCKSSTSDNCQTFKTIFGISCKLLSKKLFSSATAATLGGYFQQEKSQNLLGKWKQDSMIWDKMGCINGCMVISNLVISLVPYNKPSKHSFDFL
jgi:hypothetical protein